MDGQFTLGRDPDTDKWYLLSQQASKIVTQRFDVKDGALSGDLKILVDHGGTLSVSNTGVLLLRTDFQTSSRLLWFDRGGVQLRQLGDPGDYWGVKLSPDGRFAAVTRHLDDLALCFLLIGVDGFEVVTVQEVVWHEDGNPFEKRFASL